MIPPPLKRESECGLHLIGHGPPAVGTYACPACRAIDAMARNHPLTQARRPVAPGTAAPASSPWRKWSAPQPREIALRSKAGSRVGPR